MSVAEIIITVALVFATFMIVTTSVALWRAPNALTRANLLGPTVCVALPIVIMAKLLRDFSTHGFVINDFVRAIIAITGLLVVASVSSFYMARSVHGLESDDIIVDPPTREMRAELVAERDAAAEIEARKDRQRVIRSINTDHDPFAPEHHPKHD